MKKKILFSLSLILSFLILSACGRNSSEESSGTETTKIIEETTTVEITTKEESLPPSDDTINPLTGLNDLDTSALGKRSVSVMVNNNINSLPQYGIEVADIIFEIPVEGGITRLMAMYADFNKVPNVCSVRSCRYYFPLIANGFDSIYLHWGSDQSIALETLNRLAIDHLDGGVSGAPVFGRDAERKKTYSIEHTGYLQGSNLSAGLVNNGIRTDLKEGYNKSIFTFNSESSSQTPQGQTCATAVLNFSKAYYSTFTYDEASKTYKKQHSGKPHIDSSTGNQLSFTNVIVLKTDISLLNQGGELLNVALNSGTGKYISNGASEDIIWSKADDNSPIVLSKPDGTALTVNAGKSYIGIIGNDKTILIQ